MELKETLKRNANADIKSEKKAERLVKESLRIYEETKKLLNITKGGR